MKTNRLFISLFIAIAFISCKNEDQKEAENDGFSVEIEGVFTKNDELQVFYKLSGSDWGEENSEKLPVYGSSEMQKVELKLPKNISPENIRVDVGFNPTQNNVTIKNVSIKYKDQVIDGDNGTFTKYFYHNDFVVWDMDYYGYKLIKIGEAYDPFFMGNDLFISKLKKIKK